MPRRSPGQTRAQLRRRPRADQRISVVPGIPARGQALIAQLERARLHPGAVAAALVTWRRYVRSDPRRRNPDSCGVPACCPDPFADRRTLELAVHALPPATARMLRRHVEELDALVEEWEAPPW